MSENNSSQATTVTIQDNAHVKGTAVGNQNKLITDVAAQIIIQADHSTVTVVNDHQREEHQQEIARQCTCYLRWLLYATGYVPLIEIDSKISVSEAEARLQLGAIYTALLTTAADYETPDKRRMERAERDARLSAVAQVNAHDRLVLLGDPGSGKSTFINFTAMCLAGEWLRDDYANLTLLTAPLPDDRGDDEEERQPYECGNLLPARIVLRDFAARGLPEPGQPANANHLWNFLERELEATAAAEFAPHLKTALLCSGGLLLLDGLDEVPAAEERRPQIKQAVEEFAALYPQCRIVVTSRTYAYQRQDWKLKGFTDVTLLKFTDGQIRRFARRWYAYMGRLTGLADSEQQGRAAQLHDEILNNPRLTDLASRPLLLTLMASLHARKTGNLPRKRAELYQDTVELLLNRWDRLKFEMKNPQGQTVVTYRSLADWLKVDRERILNMIQRLAYEAHAAQVAQDWGKTAGIAEKTLKGELMCLTDPSVNPHLLEQHVRDRAGILVPHGVGVYTFPHRSFQEFLAAGHLFNQEAYPDNLNRLARQEPNRWREVVLLAGALGRPRDGWSLIRELCPADVTKKAVSTADAWTALLAAQTMLERFDEVQIAEGRPDDVQRLRDWLIAILTEQVPAGQPFPAVERALAGNLLAVLGDPRPGVGCISTLRQAQDIASLDDRAVGERSRTVPDIDWITIPAGTFLMGSDKKKDRAAYDNEQPQHKVTVKTFQISRYPVTNAQYQAFVQDGGYTEQWRKACWSDEGWQRKQKENWNGPRKFGGAFELPNHSVVGVSWYEAVAFCAWLTQKLHDGIVETHVGASDMQKTHGRASLQQIRLPTEAEWEYAARGTDGRIYPWGDEITPERANYSNTGLGTTSAVGCFPRGASPFGCDDMAGNVWKWCLDWYGAYAQQALTDPRGPDSGSSRVIRGGGWNAGVGGCRSAYRYYFAPGLRGSLVGFRLVRTPA